MTEQPPAGWYPDPADATRSRWWNGEQWTGTTRPRAQLQPAAGPDHASRGPETDDHLHAGAGPEQDEDARHADARDTRDALGWGDEASSEAASEDAHDEPASEPERSHTSEWEPGGWGAGGADDDRPAWAADPAWGAEPSRSAGSWDDDPAPSPWRRDDRDDDARQGDRPGGHEGSGNASASWGDGRGAGDQFGWGAHAGADAGGWEPGGAAGTGSVWDDLAQLADDPPPGAAEPEPIAPANHPWLADGHNTGRLSATRDPSPAGVAVADWDDIRLVDAPDDAPELSPTLLSHPEEDEEEERRRRLEYERMQRLRASRAIRQDRIEELLLSKKTDIDERPVWKRAASFLGQLFIVLAVVVVWTTILGFLLSESSDGDAQSTVPADPATEVDRATDTDTDVLGTAPEEATGSDATAADVEAAPPADDVGESGRAFGALPPIPIDFDGQCVLEVDPEELEDLSSVWPWQFSECEYAPVDLDPGEPLWIVVVSSIDGGGTPPASTPASRGGQELGLLWSSHYPSLNPGWWVVFGGPYATEGEAASARGSIGGGAYIRRLSPDDLDN